MIAGAFHRTGAVEVWGRGTNRVIAMCKKHGCAPPTFEDRQGFLIVTFKAQSVQEADTDLGSQSTVEKSREKSREKVLSLVEENTNITTAEMATGLGLSQAGIEKIIQNLKSEGRLRRVGSDKGGSWEVIK